MSHDEEHKGAHASHAAGHGGGHGGGGHAEGEHEGAPEWLISFADNVALLMGFFVILLAMNMGPKGRAGSGETVGENTSEQAMIDFAIGVRKAFNNPVRLDSSAPADQALIKRIKQLQAGDSDALEDGAPGHRDRVQAQPDGLDTEAFAVIPFAEASTIVPAQGRDAAVHAASELRGLRWIIEVRGHTSGFEVDRDHQKGFELSHQRALAVARILADGGIPWHNIRIVACSDFDRSIPRPDSRTQAGLNQRVEIIVTDQLAPGM